MADGTEPAEGVGGISRKFQKGTDRHVGLRSSLASLWPRRQNSTLQGKLPLKQLMQFIFLVERSTPAGGPQETISGSGHTRDPVFHRIPCLARVPGMDSVYRAPSIRLVGAVRAICNVEGSSPLPPPSGSAQTLATGGCDAPRLWRWVWAAPEPPGPRCGRCPSPARPQVANRKTNAKTRFQVCLV
jgi:hypothetical protein